MLTFFLTLIPTGEDRLKRTDLSDLLLQNTID